MTEQVGIIELLATMSLHAHLVHQQSALYACCMQLAGLIFSTVVDGLDAPLRCATQSWTFAHSLSQHGCGSLNDLSAICALLTSLFDRACFLWADTFGQKLCGCYGGKLGLAQVCSPTGFISNFAALVPGCWAGTLCPPRSA